MRSPLKRGSSQAPASSDASAASVWLVTGPEPSVVRLTVSSWMTTRCPSLLKCTSSSRWRAPISIARSKAAKVFSGAYDEAPRCAMAMKPVGVIGLSGPARPRRYTSGRDERGVVVALGDGRQATDHFAPVLAAVVAAPDLAGRGRGEQREGIAPVLEGHRLEGGSEPVGQSLSQDLPRLAPVGAPGNARSREVALAPRPRPLFGRRHEHELGLARVQHEQIRIASDL